MSGLLNSHLIIFATAQVFFIAFLLSYFNVQIPSSKFEFWSKLKASINSRKENLRSSAENDRSYDKTAEESVYGIILSKVQLSKFDGSPGAPGLYLALLGRIYDVSKGIKHYGPNGGYRFFAGIIII